MTPASCAGLAAAILVLAASPGPGVFATVARALSSGFRASLLVVAGIVTGDILFLFLAVFGLSVVAQIMGRFFIAIKLCGGAYLIWMGIRMWLQPAGRNGGPAESRTRAGKSKLENYAGGLAITLSNPKVILFYCGFLPTFMDLGTLNAMDIAIAVGIIAIMLAAVLAVYAFLASRAHFIFANAKAAGRLNKAAGCTMIAAGITITLKN